jgi:hypothetical protein
MRRLREHAAKARCPSCDQDRSATAGNEAVHAVFAPLPAMRQADPIPRRSGLSAVPKASQAGRREVDMSTLRKTGFCARIDGVVWPVLSAESV